MSAQSQACSMCALIQNLTKVSTADKQLAWEHFAKSHGAKYRAYEVSK